MRSERFPYKIIVALLFFLPVFTTAQSSSFFYKQGNNISQLSCGGVVFAPIRNQNHQAFGAGSVLVQKPISLLNDFSVSFVLEFTDTTGVDGGAFIFQTDPNLVGETFNGLGVKGVSNSVAITFDAKQNLPYNDPPFDHVSIQTDGVIDHNTANNLAGPVSIESLYKTTIFPPYGDREKRFTHIITVNWKAGTKELSALVDDSLLIRANADLVATVFNGNPTVYWGFAASNTQPVWYPAPKELLFGFMSFSFGDIFPRIKMIPERDTCFGLPIQVFDSSIYGSFKGLSGLTNASWFWDFGDGATSTLHYPPAHNYAQAGTYNIRFAVTNAFGCTFDTVVRKISLGAVPVADFDYTAACTNTPIAFTDKSTVADGGIFHWDWEFDGVAGTNQASTVFQFAATGPHHVYLNVRSNLGCESDTVKTITVDEKPVVNASFEEDCFGNVQYKAILQNGVRVKTWQWSFGDGQTSAEQNPLHHFLENNTYATLLQTVSEGGCVSDSIQQTITINVVKAFAGNDTIAVKGQPLQLSGSGNGKFLWSPNTGLGDPLIASPVATLYNDQTYVLTASNDQGCEAKDTVRIKVFDDVNIFVPSAFTPNGDGKNDALHLIAPGFKQLLYFRIYNRWGQLLFETKNTGDGWNGTLRNQALPSDVYVWIAAGIDLANRRQEKKGTVLLMR